MGIVLASNFDVKTNLALDSRTNKNTIEERNAIPTEVRFEGLECYVKEDGGLYRLTGGVENSNWSLIPYTDADGNLTIDGNLILNNSSTPINIKEYIDTLTAAGIHYIGTLDGTDSSPGSFTPAAEVGDMYIVSTAGYINGVEVEVGDSILCHTDTEAADSSTYTSINSNWNYVQANISTMRGATSDTPGMSGIVPIPSAGSENKYLKGDGTWSSIAQSDVTDLVNDLESKADKQNSVGGFEAGSNAHADTGASIGLNSSATTGGAMGENAKSGSGFAGGYNAKTQTSSSVVIDAIQLGSGTNSTEKTLQVYDYQLMDSTGNIPLDRIQSALDESGISGGQETAHTHANKDVLDGISSSDITNWNNKADKQNSYGGFAAGNNASATSGAAVGNNASATYGGAVGNKASATTGGAVGNNATATTGGFAGGNGASATYGGAVGYNAKTSTGFAGGHNAKTQDSSGDGIDAIQLGTGTNSTEKTLQVYDYQLMTADGQIPEARMSSLSSAKHTHNNKSTLDQIAADDVDHWSELSDNIFIKDDGEYPEIQIGADSTVDTSIAGYLHASDIKSVQHVEFQAVSGSDTYTIAYDDIVNWNNKADKQNSNGGFAAGNGASATSGGAVGNNASAIFSGFAGGNSASATSGGAVGSVAEETGGGFAGGNSASATSGGAVGSGAKTSTGFAGGYNAKTQDSSGDGINAIQLGTGTNSTAKTLQVYNYQLMTANGQIPEARMSSLSSAKHTHSNKSTLDGISSTNITSWNNKVDTSDLPNIKKNSSSTSGDIISSHITIGSRGSGTYGTRTLFVGTLGTASGQSSANIGYNNTSSGANSLTVGQSNTGTGQASGTFGLNSSTGNYSLTSGTDNEIGGYSVGMGSHISSPSNQGYCFGFGFSLETSGNNTAIGHHNKSMTKSSSSGTSGDAFVIGNGTSSTRSNAFRVTYSGAVYGKSTYHSTGADYAEYFEWEDGNPNTEDRRGLFVTWGNDGLVKLANEGDEILGVVSVTPSVVGNAYEDDWQGMYQTDIFGQPLSHIVHHDAEYVDIEMPDVDDEGNELETTHIEHQLLHEAYDAEEYILNPEYDSEQEYIPRSDRKEWAAVGLMGQLIVIDDGSCTVNGYCTVGSNGTATTSDTGFKVLKRLDDTHIKVFIK